MEMQSQRPCNDTISLDLETAETGLPSHFQWEFRLLTNPMHPQVGWPTSCSGAESRTLTSTHLHTRGICRDMLRHRGDDSDGLRRGILAGSRRQDARILRLPRGDRCMIAIMAQVSLERLHRLHLHRPPMSIICTDDASTLPLTHQAVRPNLSRHLKP